MPYSHHDVAVEPASEPVGGEDRMRLLNERPPPLPSGECEPPPPPQAVTALHERFPRAETVGDAVLEPQHVSDGSNELPLILGGYVGIPLFDPLLEHAGRAQDV